MRYEPIIKWTDTATEESDPATAAPVTFQRCDYQMRHAETMLLPVLDFKIGSVEAGEIWTNY